MKNNIKNQENNTDFPIQKENNIIKQENQKNKEKVNKILTHKILVKKINNFWKDFFLGKKIEQYSIWEDYDISDPKWDLVNLSKKDEIQITNINHYPGKFIKFYIWWTEILIMEKAYQDLINNY